MAATQTVPQYRQPCNFTPIVPEHGVVTLYGYGIKACVDRGHLILDDGIGPVRRHARLPRIGHGLRRLVVIGSDGMVTLAALRWLADQDASFVMLNRDGSAVTGPVRPSDAKLRRAQVLAHQSGAALQIVRELIGGKLEAQEKLAREGLNNSGAANAIARFCEAVASAKTMESVRLFESRAAHSYWNAWRRVQIGFPKQELHRVPEHWRSFGARVSPLTGSPRLAANPVNAILNYLYAVLESEARLSIAALGLDPGLGMLHFDAKARDSLACDVMEPVRPRVDGYVLNWLSRETLRREWFFEQRDGSCRLMGSFAMQLSQTASTWSRELAPIAESVSRALWSSLAKPSRRSEPPTRLTQEKRRSAKGVEGPPPVTAPPSPLSFCKDCGAEIVQGRSYCQSCARERTTASLIEAAKQGRKAAHCEQAQRSRADTQRRNAIANAAWDSSEQPVWLTEDFYLQGIQPRLKTVTVSAIASALDISRVYAIDIRRGRRVPHPRHWKKLAALANALPDDPQS